MELSGIQLKILTKFITAEELRYSDARPLNVDNDLYKYHLKFLTTKGYLEKVSDRYQLTEQGKLFALNLNVFGEMQSNFKIAVNCILLIKENGVEKILLQKRLRHPSFGEVSTVCGKVKRGEKIIDAANRKLKEEAGLEADFKYVGTLRAIRFNKKKELINDQWFNVCLATKFSGELKSDNGVWQNYFVDVTELESIALSNLPVKNVIEILKQIKERNTPFLIEDEAIVKTI